MLASATPIYNKTLNVSNKFQVGDTFYELSRDVGKVRSFPSGANAKSLSEHVLERQ